MPKKTERLELVWEEVKCSRVKGGIFKLHWRIHRAKVPGGWLVLVIHNTGGLTFYPDPEHQWDGASPT